MLAYAQTLVTEVALPRGGSMSDYVDAATYLREHGYAPNEVARLSGELGKALLHAKRNLGLTSLGLPQQHGPVEKAIGQYHRRDDGLLLDQVFACFKQGSLFNTVVTRSRMRDAVSETLENTRWSAKRARTS
jgi:hypothetical protein